MPPLSIAASINQSDSSLSAAMHVNGGSCFDQQATVTLTGTMKEGSVSLTSEPVDGQVVAFTGTVKQIPGHPQTLELTYAITGGCSGGDQGNVTGAEFVRSVAGNWAGDLTSDTGDVNRLWVTLTQGSATSEGTYPITGTAGFEVGTCFKEATILTGTFPSGSYVLGKAVNLEVETDNGTVTLIGTMGNGGLIEGTYTIAGGTCGPAGTFYLSPWEY